MAIVELVAPQAQDTADESEEQTIAVGAAHTIFPTDMLGGWKVEVLLSTGDGYLRVASISGDPAVEKFYKLDGPCTYIVKARSCGASAENGEAEE